MKPISVKIHFYGAVSRLCHFFAQIFEDIACGGKKQMQKVCKQMLRPNDIEKEIY